MTPKTSSMDQYGGRSTTYYYYSLHIKSNDKGSNELRSRQKLYALEANPMTINSAKKKANPV